MHHFFIVPEDGILKGKNIGSSSGGTHEALKEAEFFMGRALGEAWKAYGKEEVPVGAVVVKAGKVISRGHNERETKNNALRHAEITAIEKACRKLKSWRLDGCDLYVTLEPCPMCAGAIIQARIRKVIYGADDPKAGAAGSVTDLFKQGMFNHDVQVEKGILERDCADILKRFFKDLRAVN